MVEGFGVCATEASHSCTPDCKMPYFGRVFHPSAPDYTGGEGGGEGGGDYPLLRTRYFLS